MRLEGFDYSSVGYYFITICVKDKRELLGKVDSDVGAIINRPCSKVALSEYGQIAETIIRLISDHYDDAIVDKYVIMPNHIHMILVITNGRLIIAPTNVSVIIQQFKRQVTKQIGFSFWQRTFHDHIIRDEKEYQKIWKYIDENPIKWQEDCYFVKE